jgi:hypothetical protein
MTSSQDVILLEDERFVVAVFFVNLFVFFFDFALGLAVLLRADLFGNALCGEARADVRSVWLHPTWGGRGGKAGDVGQAA